jgi:hypothetical protein
MGMLATKTSIHPKKIKMLLRINSDQQSSEPSFETPTMSASEFCFFFKARGKLRPPN